MSTERVFLNSNPYQIESLWALTESFPVLQIPTNLLLPTLYVPYWTEAGCPISAMDLLRRPSISPMHMTLINECDLEFPIILAASNLDVLDGLHRICKSIMLGRVKVSARFVGIRELRRF